MDKLLHKAYQDYLFPELWYFVDNWISYIDSKEIVDLGCGHGLIAIALAKIGCTVSCVESSPKGLDAVKARFKYQSLKAEFFNEKLHKTHFKDNSVPCIVGVNILETSKKPAAVIKEAYRILKPGGDIVFATVNRSSWWSHPSVVKALRYQEQIRFLRTFDLLDIVNLIAAQGFCISKVKPAGKYLPIGSIFGKISQKQPGIFIIAAQKPIK